MTSSETSELTIIQNYAWKFQNYCLHIFERGCHAYDNGNIMNDCSWSLKCKFLEIFRKTWMEDIQLFNKKLFVILNYTNFWNFSNNPQNTSASKKSTLNRRIFFLLPSLLLEGELQKGEYKNCRNLWNCFRLHWWYKGNRKEPSKS